MENLREQFGFASKFTRGFTTAEERCLCSACKKYPLHSALCCLVFVDVVSCVAHSLGKFDDYYVLRKMHLILVSCNESKEGEPTSSHNQDSGSRKCFVIGMQQTQQKRIQLNVVTSIPLVLLPK